MPDKQPPRPPLEDERELDYLICRECNTPCYSFEMEKGKPTDAQCAVCGNDDILLFNLAEDQPDE